MKINVNDLNSVIKKIITETTFEINPNDSDMQQKIAKIKNDTSLYNETEDEIKIADETNESVYSKSDVLKLMAENKKKKSFGGDEYMKAIKKADRELDYELNGPGWKSKDKVHKNKAKYDRNKGKRDFLNDNVNEDVLSKADIMNMIMEKKYNGKVYRKSELISELSEVNEGENNPWAVCSVDIDRKDNPSKYERCVKKVKNNK